MQQRNTKIVATIGPASNNEETIDCLLKSGVDVARLNFSHGSHQDHARTVTLLRKLANKAGRSITILQDLQGPKIRTGNIENGQVEILKDQKLTLTTRPVIGNQSVIPIDFPHLTDYSSPGGQILLDDGNLELRVLEVNGAEVLCQVILGGVLKTHKGVNLPGARLTIPGFTEKDELDLAFGLEIGVDAVAVSFVRTETDIDNVRQAISKLSPNNVSIPIIAKLERPEALDNLEPILRSADGVMVARGDLGVEMSPERVPIAQKQIIELANQRGKFVITATQMLDSMINNPRPTRAEASDVANAIFDGTDAVMLSGETASGKYPLQAVEMMHAIILQAEKNLEKWGRWCGEIPIISSDDDTFFVTRAARELAHDRRVAAIAIFTRSGRSALLMSKTRPEVPILAFTPIESTYNRMNLYWGVEPRLVPHVQTLEEMVQVVENALVESTPVQPGQQVILICGFPIPATRPTNLTLLYQVGST